MPSAEAWHRKVRRRPTSMHGPVMEFCVFCFLYLRSGPWGTLGFATDIVSPLKAHDPRWPCKMASLAGLLTVAHKHSWPAGHAGPLQKPMSATAIQQGCLGRKADDMGQGEGCKPYTSPWDVCWAPKMAQFRHSPMGRSHCALRRTVCRTLCYNRAHCEPRCICMTFCQQTAFLL